MKSRWSLCLIVFFLFGNVSNLAFSQSSSLSNAKINNMKCEEGSMDCKKSTSEAEVKKINLNLQKKITVVYYTDPICSACWAIEPIWRKFKIEYGNYLHIEYRMGGLLEKWDGFQDKGNGISKPSDVAHHWDETGHYTGMSIDGDIWLEDPLASSYPPSLAFYAAKLQSEKKTIAYLRKIREYVFLEKKNICKEEYLTQAAKEVGLDASQFLTDYKSEKVKAEFLQHLKAKRMFGVNGFPSMAFINENNEALAFSGSVGYKDYENIFKQLYKADIQKEKITTSADQLLKEYGMLSTREVAVLLDKSDQETEALLNQLAAEGKIKKRPQKFGDFWSL